MFTDAPVTPRRLETLIELLRDQDGLSASQVKGLLQPKNLGDDPGRAAAEATLKAARELEIVREDKRDQLKVLAPASASPRSLIEAALDKKVLNGTSVEPYFALFYAFIHGCTEPGVSKWTGERWASKFNEKVFPVERPTNPFNTTKLSGLWRWLDYAGLGWFDSAGNFQPCPYGRLLRALPAIFEHKKRLLVDEFMRRVAVACPELDGGALFQQVYGETVPGVLRPPLAQALVELHLDAALILHAAPDSSGWDMSEVEPPKDKKTMRGDRLDEVEIP